MNFFGSWALNLKSSRRFQLEAGLVLFEKSAQVRGSVEKARSGAAAGVLNSTRQTGSVLGVALFGSLIGATDAFLFGARAALIISALLLISAAVIIAVGGRSTK